MSGGGVRVIVGETTGFAHTADLSVNGLLAAARAAALHLKFSTDPNEEPPRLPTKFMERGSDYREDSVAGIARVESVIASMPACST